MRFGDLRAAATDLTRSIKAYKIWSYFGLQNVILRYRRTTLGPLWIVIGMLTSGLSISFVFGGLFGQSVKQTLPFILGGMMTYYFFAAPLNEGVSLFLGHSSVINSRSGPLMSYVLETMTTIGIIFLHNLVGFFLLLAAFGVYAIPHWTFVPAILLVMVFMSFSSALTGMLGARFRDFGQLLPFMSQVLFFVTPIFWDPKNVHGPRRAVLDYNPFYYMLNLTRGPLLGQPARLIDWAVVAGMTLVVALIWLFFFGAYRRRIVFWL